MSKKPCGHTTRNAGWIFTCDKAAGHKGLHEQRTKLRDRTEYTNWDDDGLAPWATKQVRP